MLCFACTTVTQIQNNDCKIPGQSQDCWHSSVATTPKNFHSFCYNKTTPITVTIGLKKYLQM